MIETIKKIHVQELRVSSTKCSPEVRNGFSGNITDLICHLFQIRDLARRNIIESSIIEMDTIARAIDSEIDDFGGITEVSDSSLINHARRRLDILCSEIETVFEVNFPDNFASSLVAQSLESNTTGRAYVYDLEEADFGTDSTMWYVFPCYEAASSIVIDQEQRRKLFCKITSLIQITDDLIDYFDDCDKSLKTPVTEVCLPGFRMQNFKHACRLAHFAVDRVAADLDANSPPVIQERKSALQLGALRSAYDILNSSVRDAKSVPDALIALDVFKRMVPKIYCYAP